MRPDSGCYEEHYRLTWQVAAIITLGLLIIAGGALPGQGVGGLPLIGLGVLLGSPLAVLVVSHRIAFRADQEGITFGPHPIPFAPGRRFCWVSVPWKDVKEIRLVKEPFGWGAGGESSSRPFLATGAAQQPSNLNGWPTADWTLSALQPSPPPTPRALP